TPEEDADRLAPVRAEAGCGTGEERGLLSFAPEERGGNAPVDEGRARRMARAVGQVDRRRREIPSVHPRADLEGGQRAERTGGSPVEADADRVGTDLSGPAERAPVRSAKRYGNSRLAARAKSSPGGDVS